MSQEMTNEFLRDLARLLQRHGPQPLLSLMTVLTDPSKRAEIVTVLTELAKVAKGAREVNRPPKRGKAGKAEETRTLIEQLRQSDPDKAELLAQLYEGLSTRKFLPSRGEVLDFCFSLHIHVPSGAPRNRLLLPMVRHLAQLPLEDAQGALQQLLERTTKSGRKFERLASAIMKRETRD